MKIVTRSTVDVRTKNLRKNNSFSLSQIFAYVFKLNRTCVNGGFSKVNQYLEVFGFLSEILFLFSNVGFDIPYNSIFTSSILNIVPLKSFSVNISF